MEATELWCLLEEIEDLLEGYIRVVYYEYNDSLNIEPNESIHQLNFNMFVHE